MSELGKQSRICVYCGKRMSRWQHYWARVVCNVPHDDYSIWCKDCRDVSAMPKSALQMRKESGIILAALVIAVIIVAWITARL